MRVADQREAATLRIGNLGRRGRLASGYGCERPAEWRDGLPASAGTERSPAARPGMRWAGAWVCGRGGWPTIERRAAPLTVNLRLLGIWWRVGRGWPTNGRRAGAVDSGRGGWLTIGKLDDPLAVVLQLRCIRSRREGRARDGAKRRGVGPIVSDGMTNGREGANEGFRSPDAKPRPARAAGFGRGGLRHFLVLPDPLAVCGWRVAQSLKKCARDGSQPTSGRCPKGRSEAQWRTARPPKRPTEAEGGCALKNAIKPGAVNSA